MSLVIVKFHVRSTSFVLTFLGFLKFSPICGGLRLIVSGGIVCGIVINLVDFFMFNVFKDFFLGGGREYWPFLFI